MKAFIWKELTGLTSDYHDGGGATVFAPDLTSAIEALRQESVREPSSWDGKPLESTPPDFECEASAPTAAVFIFRDAGCC